MTTKLHYTPSRDQQAAEPGTHGHSHEATASQATSPEPTDIDEISASPWIGLHYKHELLGLHVGCRDNLQNP